ncbi:MAG: DUF975 family protein, partial [Butyrivibrio sp.]|nr:DUF975 family protein [Butyrivibrio sp.]
MWNIKEIKEKGKNSFKSNYLASVIVGFILTLSIGSTSTATGSEASQEIDYGNFNPEVFLLALGLISTVLIIALLIQVFIFNPLLVGCNHFFAENVRNNPASLDNIKKGFSNYLHVTCTVFVTDLFLTLWTMLFIIPGLIKNYSYRMVPYILADNPELSALETISLSRKMMNGHKWKTFLL